MQNKIHLTEIFAAFIIHILSNILVKVYFSQFSPNLNMTFTANHISESWSLLFLCGQIDKKLHNLKQLTVVWGL